MREFTHMSDTLSYAKIKFKMCIPIISSYIRISNHFLYSNTENPTGWQVCCLSCLGLPLGNDKIHGTLSTAENFVPQKKHF